MCVCVCVCVADSNSKLVVNPYLVALCCTGIVNIIIKFVNKLWEIICHCSLSIQCTSITDQCLACLQQTLLKPSRY